MAKTETRPYDPAEFLDTEEKQAAFLSAALEENDPYYFTHALGVVIRTRGVTHVAREAGLGRASLYKSFGGGAKPEFETVLRVLQALGIKLTVVPSSTGAA